jgi:2'-5' RNA ligase
VPYAVELRFDDDLTRRIQELWQALAEIGAGGSMPAGEPVPHISLALYDHDAAVDEAALAQLVGRVSRRFAATPVSFPGLGAFPTEEHVLFLAAVVSRELLQIHTIWHAMAAAFAGVCRPHYLPGRWMPHCTLSIGGSMAALVEGFSHVAKDWTPLSGMLRAVAAIHMPPVATLAEHPLSLEASGSPRAQR